MNTKRKKTGRRLLSFLLTLAMVVGLMPGMGLTAYAATDTYTTLKNNVTVVHFNNYDWYIIEDNSTSATEGTVTLLAADNAFGLSAFSDSDSNAYSSSKIKAALDAMTQEGGDFAAVKDAIADTDLADVSVTGAKLYLLSTSEAQSLNQTIRGYIYPDAEMGEWWLRSAGNNTLFAASAAVVFGQSGLVYDYGDDVHLVLGVRPALKLDLSKVTFDSDAKTFTVGSATVAVTGVTLNPSTAQTIDVDGTVSFTATVSPDNATDKTVKWSVGGTNSGAVKLYTDADCTTEVGADATETLTVYAKGISAGSATVTATSNADSTKTASCEVTADPTPIVITSSNFSDYFDENGVLKDTVPAGSVLDFQGEFLGEQYKLTINKKVTVTSTSNPVAKFDSTSTEDPTNVMTFSVVAGADYTTISNLEFLNCRLDI